MSELPKLHFTMYTTHDERPDWIPAECGWRREVLRSEHGDQIYEQARLMVSDGVWAYVHFISSYVLASGIEWQTIKKFSVHAWANTLAEELLK
jgi:hypothetical protein